MPDRHIVSAAPQEGDQQLAAALRPRRLADFTGQTKLKENLSIAIEAAKHRGEAMDHVLLYGPPGLGKTTLANIIASELGVTLTTTAAQAAATLLLDHVSAGAPKESRPDRGPQRHQ